MQLGHWIEWHAAIRPVPGQTACGDACLALPRDDGLLLAALDGLGHGAAAAEVADRACAVLRESSETSLDVLLERCHRALVGSRGVAMTLALLHPHGRLDWLGVGNVEAVVVRGDADGRRALESVMLQPGVVGYQIPTLRPSDTAFAPGDILVMATDGVRTAFIGGLSAKDSPARLAPRILQEYGKHTDDALVLAAARLRGSE